MARVVKVTLRAEIAEYKTAMLEAANQTRAVGTETERLAQKREAFQKLGQGLLVVGGAMTALTLSVMKTGIEYNTLQQSSRAALTTLLGGAKEASAQMDKLDAFARTSPFAKTTFITAQQQMLAFGIESKKVIPYLDAIQDAVAAAGGSNQQLAEVAFVMAQISAAGKITGQDLIQFGQRGINAAELIGQSMGKTGAQIKADITAGTLGADEALDALAAGMKNKFDGAAASVKDTFAGAMDRVQAAWRDLAADLAKPLVDPNGGGALVGLLNWAADMMRAVQQLPEPIKIAGGAMFAFAGFIALAAGAVLVATPRLIAMRVAFLNLSGAMRGIALAGGIATIALTALVAIIGAVSAAQAQAQALADQYADALAQGGAAAQRFVAEQLAMKDSFLWMDRGSAVENAKKLGISLEEVTKAVTGTADEYEAFKTKVDEAYAAAGKTLDAGYAMEQLKNKVDSLRGAQELQADQASQVEEATDSMTGSVDAAAVANEELQQATEEANKVLDAMSAALDGVAGTAMSMSEAQDKAISSINGLKEAADAEGVTFDGTNDASIKFRDSIRDVEAAHRDSAEAIIKNGGTLADAEKEWQKGRDAVISMLEAKGMDRAEAVRWADQQLGSASDVKKGIDAVYRAWLNLPENKQTKYEVEKAEAERALDALKAKLASIPTYRRITLEGFTVGNFDVSPNATGNLYSKGVKIDNFAAGGWSSGVGMAKATPGGLLRVAEAGYDEAIISTDPKYRGRSMGLVEEMAGRLGMWQQGSSQAAPVVNVAAPSLDGLAVEGRITMDPDGFVRLVDGRIVQHDAAAERTTRGRLR